MPERRWRVKRSKSKGLGWYAAAYPAGHRAPEQGSGMYWQSWSAAMGYANLMAWRDRGGVL